MATKTSTVALITTALAWAYGTGAERMEYSLGLDRIGFPQGVTAQAFYLLQNGFKQSMADSIAGYAKELKAEVDDKGNRTYTDAEVHGLIIEALDERFQGIVEGTVGLGIQGPRLRGIDKVMRDIATDELRGLYASNPKLEAPQVGSPQWKALVDKYIARNDAKLRADAQKRLDMKADASDIEALMAEVADLSDKVEKPKAKPKAKAA